jgi:hypothetical protein
MLTMIIAAAAVGDADTTKATTNPTDKTQPPVATCPDNYNRPVESDYLSPTAIDARFCCTQTTNPNHGQWGDPGTNHDCYTGPNVCAVASPAFRCCGIETMGGKTGGYAQCLELETKDQCDGSYQWCGTTEPPTADTTKAVEENFVYEKGGCDHLDVFTTRVTNSDETSTMCCRPDTPKFKDCILLLGHDICNVATPTFPCCFAGQGGTHCTNKYTAAECKPSQDTGQGVTEATKWCGDTPADTEDTLPPAAVAGIAIAAVALVAAAAALLL